MKILLSVSLVRQFPPIAGPRRALPGWMLISCLWGLFLTPLWAQDLQFSADFEAPAYQPGSIHGQQGWSVEQGVALVTVGAGRNSGGGLVMEPASPFSQATLLLNGPSSSTSSCFLDFHVAPAATDETRKEEMLDVDSARIGFFRSAAQPAKGKFWIFNGDGAGGGTWQATLAELPVDAVTGRPSDWVRLTLREDFVARSWDFWVNGRLAASAAGFQETTADNTDSYVILGDAVERLVLDDLTIGGPNPLGPDADGDGMLDRDEARIRSNPAVSDRSGLDAAGVNFGDKWRNLQPIPEITAVAKVSPPVFSRPSGVTGATFTLSISSAAESVIYYTTDGSDPLPAVSPAYSGPFSVATTTVVRACAAVATGEVSPTTASAWVFPDHVAGQIRSPGWPEALAQTDPATGGTRLFPLGLPLTTGAAGPVTAGAVALSLEQAPIVVLTMPLSRWFGADGIYERSLQSNLKAAGEVIWMDAGGGPSGGASNARIAVSGQTSRSHEVTVKHSLRVTLPTAAEAGTMFGVASFPATQFVLRHPTSDSWVSGSGGDARRRSARYLSDAWASRWLSENGHPALRHHWVHVFLNDVYWGVYDAVEQHDTAYAARHVKAGSERRLLEPAPEMGKGSVKSIIGSSQGWADLVTRLQRLASGGALTPNPEWRDAVASLDTAGLIDYMLWHWWLQPTDWPEKNWLVSWEGAQWRPIQWDGELAMPEARPELPSVAARISADAGGPAAVFTTLSYWADFRSRVADRFQELSRPGGALSPSSLAAGFGQATEALGPMMAAESARWGTQYGLPFLTPTDWQTAVGNVRLNYLPKRTLTMSAELATWLAQQKDASHRNPSPEEMASRPKPKPPAMGGFPQANWPLLDSDGDGLPDYWERLMGLDPFNAADAMADADLDGRKNIEEFLARSSARRPDARPALAEDRPGLHNSFIQPSRRRVLPAAR